MSKKPQSKVADLLPGQAPYAAKPTITNPRLQNQSRVANLYNAQEKEHPEKSLPETQAPKKPSFIERATKFVTDSILGTPEQRAARAAKDARYREKEDNMGAGPAPVITEELRKASLAAKKAANAEKLRRQNSAENNRGSTEPGQGSRADTAGYSEQTKAVVAASQTSQGAGTPTPPPSPKGTGLNRTRSNSSQSAGRG